MTDAVKKQGAPVGELEFTGRFCGGLIADVKRRGPYFLSDWTDAFRPSNMQLVISTVYFLFFVCLSPALAFGTLMGEATDNQLGVVETLMSTAMVGVLYSLFSGQPLCIQGATGPELAYTVVFYRLCEQLDIEFLPARVWQGLWCSLFTIVLAMTDSCALMSHFTRFVQDIFAGLISKIYLVSAGKSLVDAYINKDREAAFLTTILCFATFGITMKLKAFKNSIWLSRGVRSTLANFSAPIAILIVTCVANIWRGKSDIEWLDVPAKFGPSWENPETGNPRPWIVNPFGINKDFPVWAIFATMVPALGLALLGYLDQNLTTIIVNRPASKLKKPAGYHLDLFMCGVVVYPVCCIFGLPFTHNSTAPSLMHLLSLTSYKEDAASTPSELKRQGSRREVSAVVEQRFTNFAIHSMIGASLALSPFLKYVPKSVSFGMFLVEGTITAMAGNQLFERAALWLVWEKRNVPKYNFVTKVDRRQMQLYTIIQGSCLIVLFAMTEVKQVAVIFPFFMGSLVFVRKILPRFFTEAELNELDSAEEKPMEDELVGAVNSNPPPVIAAEPSPAVVKSEVVLDSTPAVTEQTAAGPNGHEQGVVVGA
mmetsp:Transcript_62010/g.115096  ORF Transcript_62010/g.115096 Transcript_62010/m.115096 type:complete len:596 (+) Transcript_62010:71-1858(+)